MKKFAVMTSLCFLGVAGWAAETAVNPDAAQKPVEGAAAQPLHRNLKTLRGPGPVMPRLTEKQQRKLYKQRNKEILKLAKQYRKASEADKPQIKAKLSAIVSKAMDEGMARSQQQIADTRNNLDKWQAKLDEEQKNWPAVKAQRVDDILSGEAERRHKLAQKRWKAEMKAMKERIH